MKSPLVAVLTLCPVLMFVSLQQISAKEEKNARNLFENKCGMCHSIEIPRSKMRTKEEWEATVMRMKKVNGAPINDEEAKIVIDHLAKNYGK